LNREFVSRIMYSDSYALDGTRNNRRSYE